MERKKGNWWKWGTVAGLAGAVGVGAAEQVKPNDTIFSDVKIERPEAKEPGQQEAIQVKLEEKKEGEVNTSKEQ